MTVYNDSYLMHYGVLGMKWGVHRTKRAKKKYAAKAGQQAVANARNASFIKKNWNNPDVIDDKNSAAAEWSNSVATAKYWMQTRQDILDLPAESTTVAEVKNFYKAARKSAKVYYPFG